MFGVLVLAVFESAELTNEDGYLRVENSAVFYTPANELSENKKQYLLLNNNFESAMIPIKITDLTSEQDAIVSISRSGNSLIHKIIFFPFHKKIVYNPYRSIKIRELRIDKQKYKNGTYDELISALPKGAD